MENIGTSMNDDNEIIRIIKTNNPSRRQAENLLFSQYSYFIKEGMARYSLNQEDAFSAYSDTILQSIENISESLFEERASLKTYIYRIFHNKCVDLVRKNTTNKRSVYQTEQISDMMNKIGDRAKNIVQQMIEKNDAAVLKQRISELGDLCQKLLTFFADGYTDREIAKLMDYKGPEVVKTSRLRCLNRLRELYKTKKQ